MDNLSSILPMVIITAFFAFKLIKRKTMISRLAAMPKDSYTLLDVRTPEEAAQGILDDARNIPLGELASKVKFMDKTKPVYVYCASGARSSQAVSILKQAGFQAHNLGSYSALRG